MGYLDCFRRHVCGSQGHRHSHAPSLARPCGIKAIGSNGRPRPAEFSSTESHHTPWNGPTAMRSCAHRGGHLHRAQSGDSTYAGRSGRCDATRIARWLVKHRRKLVVRIEKLMAGPASGWLSSGPPFVSVGTMAPTHAPNTREGSSFLLSLLPRPNRAPSEPSLWPGV